MHLKNQTCDTGTAEFNVPHALAANPGMGDFDATTVTHDTFMFDPFIFAAITLPVAIGPKNPFTEQSTFFRLERPVN